MAREPIDLDALDRVTNPTTAQIRAVVDELREARAAIREIVEEADRDLAAAPGAPRQISPQTLQRARTVTLSGARVAATQERR